MKDSITKIICPYCGQEYLPSEIYVPKNFFGTQSNIERDFSGKVVAFDGSDMDLKETYKCDCCDNIFYVNAQVKFSASKQDEKYDFDSDYTSEFKIKKYQLFEE